MQLMQFVNKQKLHKVIPGKKINNDDLFGETYVRSL